MQVPSSRINSVISVEPQHNQQQQNNSPFHSAGNVTADISKASYFSGRMYFSHLVYFVLSELRLVMHNCFQMDK